ncbi:MAG: hypothetical protein AB7U29_10945 [Desulfobulbus sp.]
MTNKTFVLTLLLSTMTILGLVGTIATAATNGKGDPDQAIVCLGMCSDIRKLCAEEIASGNVAGRDLKDGILDEASCQLMCEADWDTKTFDCVSAADTCSQFFDESPYCVETEEEAQPAKPSAATEKSCSTACKNYAKCAGYGDDVTAQDQVYAYESCMKICPVWTTHTRTCIATTAIRSASDCAAQTMCMFGSMQNMIPKNMPKR